MRIADENQQQSNGNKNGNGSNGHQPKQQPQQRQQKKRKKQWRRKPQPKFFRNKFVENSIGIEDSNTTNEVSKVEFLKVFAPPFTEVKVERTVHGDAQVVVEQAPLWRFDSNKIDLKQRGKPLVVGQNEVLTVTLVNPRADAGAIHASVHIEKDQLLPARSGSPEDRW